MPVKLFLLLQKRLLKGKNKKTGFTILELLIAVVISGIIVIVLVDMVVDLLQSDRREYARNETQREMQMALDYMVNDLREAAYVYNNKELNESRGTSSNIPALKNYLPSFPSGFEPILAFWKPEQVPYQQQNQNINCGTQPNPVTPAWQACNNLQVKRRTFTLVVYLQKMNEGTERQQWKGVSRIMRYQLRMYKDTAFNSSTPDLSQITTGYVEPLVNSVSFTTWPGTLDGSGNFIASGTPRPTDENRPVLVDFVDYPISPRPDGLTTPADPRDQCPANYTRTPPNSPSGFNNPSFAVCVSLPPSTTSGSGGSGTTSSTNQDVIVFLRGNPTGKAGVKVAPLIAVKTQAVARGVIDKKPE